MPHVIVKLVPGKSEEQKQQFAKAIVEQGMLAFGLGEEFFSVGFEEVERDDWKENVYQPEITAKWDSLYKKPGYTV
jgi:4-oxalocrotonate tautomerase